MTLLNFSPLFMPDSRVTQRFKMTEIISPDELRELFAVMRTNHDLAALLGTNRRNLLTLLYRTPKTDLYHAFEINKRSGGKRQISVPNPELKRLQRTLNDLLILVYEPNRCVQGFQPGRSIVTNAEAHMARRRRYILNVDLQDFFPSINFGRVRGMFMNPPYNLPPKVASVLAQLCCFNNQLPQGAPTSPIISNMICAKMDSQLIQLARKHRCFYTRYADDLTFSTYAPTFPRELAEMQQLATGLKLAVGTELRRIVEDNGFHVQEKKVRLQSDHDRQEVTGVTVNKFPNVSRKFVRQIRAMLHAWEKYGLYKAEEVHRTKHQQQHRSPIKGAVRFKQVVRGKIEHLGAVRGKTDPLYLKFLLKYKLLLGIDPNKAAPPQSTGQVFISYSRKDADFALTLALFLDQRGVKVWIDVADIPAGVNWGTAIQDGLDISSILLLIMTPNAMESRNVENEWQYFIDNNKPIIPLLIQPTRKHFQLSRLNHIDFYHTLFDTAIARLSRELSRYGVRLTE